MKRLPLAAAALALCASARAADPAPLAGSAMQTLFGLLAVLAVIGALAWVVRRINPVGRSASRLIDQVASAPLGPRERVVVLEIGTQWLVLGVTPRAVTCLHTMPRGELPAAPRESGFSDSRFAELLKGALHRGTQIPKGEVGK